MGDLKLTLPILMFYIYAYTQYVLFYSQQAYITVIQCVKTNVLIHGEYLLTIKLCEKDGCSDVGSIGAHSIRGRRGGEGRKAFCIVSVK